MSAADWDKAELVDLVSTSIVSTSFRDEIANLMTVKARGVPDLVRFLTAQPWRRQREHARGPFGGIVAP